MSANEHSAPDAVDNAPSELNEESGKPAKDKRLLRDTIIASSVLGVLMGALVVYVAFSRDPETAQEARQEISARSWLGGGAGDQGDVPEAAQHSAGAEAPKEEAKAPKEETYAPSPEEDAPAPVEADAGQRHGTVQSGVPVITSLQKLGLSIQQAHALISALSGIYDFRKARPGQSFELSVAADGEPDYFAYHVSRTEVYEVVRKGDGLKGKKKHIPTDRKIERYGGTIASSLYKTLSDLDAHPSLAGKIVDVLANEVDFYKEQRPGDTFRVVVESESLEGEFLSYGPVLALEYNGVKCGKKRFFRFDGDGREAYYDIKGISQPRSVISIPLHYTRLSSRFGTRYHPILKRKKLHNGVDFAASAGTPVWACREGVVTLAERKGANGLLVAIKHDEDLQSYYAHLQRLAKGIKSGVHVRERQVIGYVGSTGRSTGPHLHFGLKKGSTFIDPLKYKVQPGRPVAAKYRKTLKALIAKMGNLLDHTSIAPPSEPVVDTPEPQDEALGVEDW
jgi:murein DD-endopeptidase MepM/ murein hydrolase activator NlpD